MNGDLDDVPAADLDAIAADLDRIEGALPHLDANATVDEPAEADETPGASDG